MKIPELLNEMPYLHPGEMNRKVIDGSYSVDALTREFKKLGHVADITVLINKDYSLVIGISDNVVPDEKNRILPEFYLSFKRKPTVNFPHNFTNLIQVDKVAITPAKGNLGIMSSVYKMLVDSGFTLVSDVTQYDPAQALWRKLTSDKNYTVCVADTDYGLFKDEDGTPVEYNGRNMPDSDIWTQGSDFGGQYRMLILKAK